MVAHSTGEWPDALTNGLDSSVLTPDLADTLFDGHFCVSEFALTSGESLDGIEAVAGELHASAVRTGARRARVFAATVLGEVALIGGRVDEAVEHLRDAVRLSREIGAYSAEALATVRLGEAAHAVGEAAEGEALLADGIVLSRWSPMSGHLLPLGYAALLRATSESDLAGRRLDDADAYLRNEENVCAYCGMAYRVAATIAAARAGRLEAAAMLLAGAEATSALWRGGPWPAALEEARGELAWAYGDRSQAEERFCAARDAFLADGRRLEADRLGVRLAELR
jgi:ATP/maltotriose-dependent transcriptional regulator MalT